ncbi:transporter [Methylobacterium sp. WL30]|uniref:transporter n=1 Tax=unclassified Methylobacterium TaxID=2615210 RepID=UPI0011CBE48B|nr:MULTISPECIES: transporter [unclassified Methylobacterium]MCJ2038491.1 transporter [Methylobacterium sp. J-059]TXM89693.1 transporter [Methylobacterium sp. WL116]TXN25713.1 transporter [Methylobacterium sp. WL93]TXN46211.1 transporter [Methylobacterium sp. WL119]TXN64659.1 transporter [Methylobacterium sp. WL30]
MMKTWLAAGAVALTVGMSTTVLAGPVTQPGEQVGLAYGPLPQGVYAINTFSTGRGDARNSPDVGVNVPILVWSTGYKVLGATIMPVIAVPSVFVGTNNPAGVANQDQSYFYNPFIGNIFAWDLGNKISAAYLVGAYVGVGDRGSLCNGAPGAACIAGGATPVLPQVAGTSIRNTGGISYTGEGWNLTAALTHILQVDDAPRFGGQVGAALGPIPNSDGLYIDLTATKTFGKFEIGAVAYGYTDLPVNRNRAIYANYQKQGTFAAGGLIGYDFGIFKTQLMVTRTVADRGVGPFADETRGWVRFIAPLYTTAAAAVAAPTPLVRKY